MKMRYRNTEIEDPNQRWRLEFWEDDIDRFKYLSAPGLEQAIRNGARMLVESLKNDSDRIEMTGELEQWSASTSKRHSVCIKAEFNGEKPTWMAYYRTPVENNTCSVTHACVGFDLRSKWFGVKVPGILGETITMSFDSNGGEKTIRGKRSPIARQMQKSGYQVYAHVPFMKWHSDF